MVVNDRDTVAGAQQSGIFNLFRAVGIHNHQKRPGIRRDQRFLRRKEDILVFRLLLHPLDQCFGCVIVRLNHNLGLDAELSGKAADPNIRAYRIQIRKFVSHHKNFRGVADQFRKSIGHDARLHFGSLLDLEASSAKELKVHPVFDDGLISAAREGQFHTDIGKLKAFLQVCRLGSETDADTGRNAVRVLNVMHFLIDGELVLAHLVDVFLLKDNEISVSVISA